MGNDPQPSARLKVKFVPGSSSDQIVGWLGDALKTKVAAPPEKGKANKAVIALVAERLGVAPGAVEIVASHSTATKELSITGIEEDVVENLLG